MGISDVVIRVEGLGKKYSLQHEQSERYTALRDVVARQAKAAGRLLNPFTLAGQLRKAQRQAAQDHAASEEEFWALKDVSFEIRRGERVGIIGRNGAGKSTLLKILSRITEPTTGRVEIRGRVASLLEVGTGFHPELTGRENIYLNGAILGMTRREIRAKFDEIVDFAEVEKFLDTPVKRYSSGMYVRLAFAVAAHLEPEILVVDEVLAVGDSSFQSKCLWKMEEVSSKRGRTILFVSHNMLAINRLCSSCIMVEGGTVVRSGKTAEVVSLYTTSNLRVSARVKLANHPNRINSTHNVICSARVLDHKGNESCHIKMGESFNVELYISGSYKFTSAAFGVGIESDDCGRITSLSNQLTGDAIGPTSKAKIIFIFNECQLTAGKYHLTFSAVDNGRWVDCVERALSFEVQASDVYGSGITLEHGQGKFYSKGSVSQERIAN